MQDLSPQFAVLIVDDEEAILESYLDILAAERITNVSTARDPQAMLSRMNQGEVGVVLLDLSLPGGSGRDLLPLIRRDFPDVLTIVVTANREVSSAVECIRMGAFDYLVKPVHRAKMIAAVEHAIEIQELRRENLVLRRSLQAEELSNPEAFSSIITSSDRMKALFHYADSVSRTSNTVLITGETGTGKELMARALHRLSGRTGDLVAVNVSEFDDAMFADALFGHVRGAYTGADRPRRGLIERAAGGTLFLDEIGDLTNASQLKLLRLTESREYLPVGADVPRSTDARILVATNRDLEARVGSGGFRKDLLYRLRTHHVHLLPLRDRKGDLALLVEHFLAEAAREMGKGRISYPPELTSLLRTYHFPGNIRELRAMVYDAASKHRAGVLSMSTFREAVGPHDQVATEDDDPLIRFTDRLPSIRQATEYLVDEALARAEGNQTLAASLLGISQPALNKRLKKRRELAEEQSSRS